MILSRFLKITSSGGTINGFITVYPCRTGSRPGTSSLNVAQFGPKGNPFPDAANVVFAQTDDLGRICVFTQHRAQLQIEAFGYWPRVP